ncbi:MAG: ABC transporter, permease protein (cluster 13, osmolytes) [uncultured Nocardioidaceae bacterium]|uniref:ABC transporter, permease protein (Cluster 13, osmolytes) n=1 Tax=uncultured Nocardioidaceae bacterium TaxID=253824 RepID=A0A6J4MZH4_9ACTN|nr:MAG: ABC transporter, permease protein (cluster 13, osmolytes) [uncultured Nocardioidaceae bacterium]
MATTAEGTPGANLVAWGAPTAQSRGRRRSLWGYLFMPLVLTGILVVLYFYVQGQELTTGEANRLNSESIRTGTWEQIELTVVSSVLVLAIAIPMGIVLTRPFARSITPPAIAVFNIGQAIPSIGLIVLLAVVYDIGFRTMVIALVAYTVLPVLRNTMVGLRQVDASVIEAARGMGMTKGAVLTRIELPLAVPIIMAGLRTALTINVGTATLGALVGAGTLGELIVAGIVQNRQLILVVGAILVAVLALLVDYLAAIAEEQLRPRGL